MAEPLESGSRSAHQELDRSCPQAGTVDRVVTFSRVDHQDILRLELNGSYQRHTSRDSDAATGSTHLEMVDAARPTDSASVGAIVRRATVLAAAEVGSAPGDVGAGEVVYGDRIATALVEPAETEVRDVLDVVRIDPVPQIVVDDEMPAFADKFTLPDPNVACTSIRSCPAPPSTTSLRTATKAFMELRKRSLPSPSETFSRPAPAPPPSAMSSPVPPWIVICPGVAAITTSLPSAPLMIVAASVLPF